MCCFSAIAILLVRDDLFTQGNNRSTSQKKMTAVALQVIDGLHVSAKMKLVTLIC